MMDALYSKHLDVNAYAKEILTFIELFLLIDLKKYLWSKSVSTKSSSNNSRTT